MSQNNNPILYSGLDVAKSSLQLHIEGNSHLLSNDRKGHTRLLKLLRPFPYVQVVCEATGGYERTVVRVLQAAGLPVAIVEAGRVRHFARAQGRRAKTDPIDAAVLTAFGQTMRPSPTPPPTVQQQQLAELACRRRQLIRSRVAETNRAEHYTDALCRRQHRQLLRLLETQIEACDKAILELISCDPKLAHKAKRLDAIAGVGPVVAATVLAEMPELGTLTHKAASALAGLAPYNRDSGDHSGTRHVAGGRKNVRTALYMATLCAVRHDRILKDFYQRLRANGKRPLVAVTACMRKLIVLMNRLLKNENFQLAS